MKPILFSTPMVLALLDGRKSQTRRIAKPQPSSGIRKSVFVKSGLEDGHGREIKPRYQPSDILWVRETWKCVQYDSMDGNLGYEVEFRDGERKYFEFDDNERFHQFGKFAFKEGWQSSLFMPREAARIFLRVKTVRVERLQEITEEDARAEGVNGIPRSTVLYPNDDYIYPFKQLWNSLNQKRSYGWDTNPWVWVIEFEKISKEESEVEQDDKD